MRSSNLRRADFLHTPVRVRDDGGRALRSETSVVSAWLNPDHTILFSSGLYVYALGTQKLEPGSYELRFTAGADPKLHALQVRITK